MPWLNRKLGPNSTRFSLSQNLPRRGLISCVTQVRIQDLCKGGPKRDFADIAQRSRGGGKNLDLKIGSQGGPGP